MNRADRALRVKLSTIDYSSFRGGQPQNRVWPDPGDILHRNGSAEGDKGLRCLQAFLRHVLLIYRQSSSNTGNVSRVVAAKPVPTSRIE